MYINVSKSIEKKNSDENKNYMLDGKQATNIIHNFY